MFMIMEFVTFSHNQQNHNSLQYLGTPLKCYSTALGSNGDDEVHIKFKQR